MLSESDRGEIEQWAESVDWSTVDFVVLLGFDPDGVTLGEIRARSDVPILVLDPDGSGAPTDAVGVESFSSADRLRWAIVDRAIRGQQCEAIVTGHAEDCTPELIAPFKDALERAYQAASSDRVTRMGGAHRWVRLALQMIPRLGGVHVVTRLQGALSGVPAIICGAGPSLDDAIPELASAQHQALIISVNTAVPALVAGGVTPHIIVAADPSERVTEDVSALRGSQRARLCSGVHISTELHGDVDWLAIHDAGGLGCWLADALGEETLPNGGSVSTLALGVAVHLGCDPLILVGQDCAYTGERLHATGCRDSAGFETRAALDGGFQLNHGGGWVPAHKVPAWGGAGEVVASLSLSGFREWFEDVAIALKDKKRLINATGAGASIRGWEELRLEDVDHRLEPVNVDELLGTAEANARPIDAEALRRALAHQLSLAIQVEKVAEKLARATAKAAQQEQTLRQLLNEARVSAAWVKPVMARTRGTSRVPLVRLEQVYRAASRAARDEVRPLLKEALKEVRAV